MTCEQNIGFDEFCDTIRIATTSYFKTGPSMGPWGLSWHALGRIALQFGKDGSSRIAHGLTHPDATTIFVQLSRLPDAVYLDGHVAKWHDVAILPPSTHFTFVSDHQMSWLAIAIPSNLQGEKTARSDFPKARSLFERKSLVTLAPSSADRFIEAAEAMKALLVTPSQNPDAVNVAAAEDEFVGTVDKLLTQHIDAILLPSEYNESSERIIFKALEYVRARTWEPITVDDLVAVTEVEYRTLLRAFQRFLNMGPKRYLKLRQLNVVRLALRHAHDDARKVTRILAENGVTEFGRFAIEYKQLFGEAPSDTAKHERVSH